MARGLGAFFSGVAEGYQTSKKLNAMEAAEERDKQRMKLDEDRMRLERDRYDIEKSRSDLANKLTQQQLDTGERQAAEEKRKLDMRNQVSKNTQELLAWRNGQAPAPEWLPTVADGPMRKRGVGQSQPTPLDPNEITETQFRRLVNGIQQKALIDYGALDADAIEKQVQFQKMIKNEGVFEAFDHFEKNQDSPRALKIFEKNGAFGDVPKGTFLRTERDPETGVSDIVVYRPGPDGKPQRYTSRSEILSAMMPENLVKYAQDMNKSRYEQTQQNNRTDKTVAGGITQAQIGARAQIASVLSRQDGKNNDHEIFKDLILDPNGKVMNNPNFALNPESRLQSALDTFETAQRLYAEAQAAGRPIPHAKAAADAMRIVEEAIRKQGKR
jgi:hypothetical protein